MIIVTTEYIPGMKVTEVKGLVRGNAVRARAIGRDITAALRNIIGGEVPEYTRLLTETREIAIQRMIEQAQELGANAIVGTRLVTAAGIAAGASEILAYGTAVVVEEEDLAAGPHVPTEYRLPSLTPEDGTTPRSSVAPSADRAEPSPASSAGH